MISADDAALAPLHHDAAVLDRVGELIGRAIRRQLWLLFLDGDDAQLPLMIPVDELPVLPGRDADPLALRDAAEAEAAGMLTALVEAAGAAAVVAVLERPGPDPLSVDDRAWASVLDAAASTCGVRLRGVLLCSDDGVRWIGQEDRG